MTGRAWVNPYSVNRRTPDGSFEVDEFVDRIGGGVGRLLGRRTPRRALPTPQAVEMPSGILEPTRPLLVGDPVLADCSTSTALAITPEVIWDVNGYYRELGIPFPYRGITKSRLRLAYLASGAADDARKAYCFNQLADPGVRAEYNEAPLGEPYLDDYWESMMRAKAKKEVADRIARGEVTVEKAEEEELVNERLQEWGLKLEDETIPEKAQEAEATPARKAPSTAHIRWSFYLWRCSYDAIMEVRDRLDTWRTLLVEAFREQAPNSGDTFRVGFLGKQPHPSVTAEVDGHLVFFLNKDQEPTAEEAARAVRFTLPAMSSREITPTIAM